MRNNVKDYMYSIPLFMKKKKDVYIPTYECMCKAYIFIYSRHIMSSER